MPRHSLYFRLESGLCELVRLLYPQMLVAYGKSKSIRSVYIISRIVNLDDHSFPLHLPARKVQLVTSSTPRILNISRERRPREAVGERIVNRPGRLISA